MQEADDLATLRLALRTALAARRLHPAKVARALDVSPGAVDAFAYGDARLSPDALRLLEELLRGKP